MKPILATLTLFIAATAFAADDATPISLDAKSPLVINRPVIATFTCSPAVNAGIYNGTPIGDWTSKSVVVDFSGKAGALAEYKPIAEVDQVFPVLIQQEKTGVKSLTVKQLKAILSGGTRNWNEIGGKDLPIRVYFHNGENQRKTCSALLEKLEVEAEKAWSLGVEYPGKDYKDLQKAAEKDPGALVLGFNNTMLESPELGTFRAAKIEGTQAGTERYPLRIHTTIFAKPQTSRTTMDGLNKSMQKNMLPQ